MMRVANNTHWNTADLKRILQRAAEMELEPAQRARLLVKVVYARRHSSSSGCAVLGGRHVTICIPKGPPAPWPAPVASGPPPHHDDPARSPSFWLRLGGGSYASFPTEEARDVALRARLRQHDDMAQASVDGTPAREAWLRRVRLAVAHVACHEFAHIRGMQHAQMPGRYRWRGKDWQAYVAWAADLPLSVKVPTKRPLAVELDRKLAYVAAQRKRAETRVKRAATILKKWQRRERLVQRRLAATRAEAV